MSDEPIEKIGVAVVFLSPLSYFLNIHEEAPIIDPGQGVEMGKLHIDITLENLPRESNQESDTIKSSTHASKNVIECPEDENLSENDWKNLTFKNLEGSEMKVRINIKRISGLTPTIMTRKDLQIRYVFDPTKRTAGANGTCVLPEKDSKNLVNQEISHSQSYPTLINNDLYEWFAAEGLEFELWAAASVESKSPSSESATVIDKVKFLELQSEKDALHRELLVKENEILRLKQRSIVCSIM